MLPLRDNAPTRSFPVVTVGLIAANFVVWLWELGGTPVDTDVIHYGYYPCTVHGPCLNLFGRIHRETSWWDGTFTSMFMHASWEHILGNMLFLWIFGNNVEDALGRFRFLLWYLAAGVAATATQTFVTLHWGNARDASIPNVGASGAIAAVLGAYFVLLPRARVLTLIFFFILREIPAVFFLGLWIAYELWVGGTSLVHPEASGGVAVFAHIGGFAFGALTVRAVAQRRPLPPAY